MHYPTLKNMMQSLIANPSVSSVSEAWDQSNEGIIQQLADWCRSAGFKVEVLPIPNCPGKYNLIATAGSGPDGLVLSGHTDTVPFDEDKWSNNPLQLTEQSNRWYGLGTADMKGFFAVVLEAIREIDFKQLKQPLILLATADEESSMCGAKSLAQQRPDLGRHAIIGEPTNLKPIRTHKGIAMEALRITGQAGHSSNPALGNNALEGMHQAIDVILQWRHSLQERYQNPLFDVATPTLNLGHIHGGDNPNRICAQCEMHFDLRPLPGMNLDDLREELDQRLAQRLADTGLSWERIPLFEGIPAMDTPAHADIVKASEQLTGYSAEAVAFGTEGPYLNELGLDTIILGPGNIDQAHQADEYIDTAQFKPAVKLIQQLIKRFCL
jgi:acetylornithine deacetylase